MENLYKTILPGQTIGIIGGGQLGRMMAIAAKKRGYKIAVLDPTNNSPCAQIADVEIVAPFNNIRALEKLASISDCITYEFENIDYESLLELTKIAYIPQGAEIIKRTQNRILEKELITQAGLKTAPYQIIQNEYGLLNAISILGLPSILKTAIGGYDGKGQYVIQNESEIHEAKKLLKNGDCILEKFVHFEKEISVIITRSVNGEVKIFPIAENIHKHNILHLTIAPARINSVIEEKAKHMALTLAEKGKFVGTFAIEMFVTENNEVLINELAPRPHNSGHFTIEACEVSQFDQHILAICNLPLGNTEILKPAVMVNILGEHVNDVIKQLPMLKDWHVHLYGKKEVKEKRKMGHATLLKNDVNDAIPEIYSTMIW